jgi:hypothetical protein
MNVFTDGHPTRSPGLSIGCRRAGVYERCRYWLDVRYAD